MLHGRHPVRATLQPFPRNHTQASDLTESQDLGCPVTPHLDLGERGSPYMGLGEENLGEWGQEERTALPATRARGGMLWMERCKVSVPPFLFSCFMENSKHVQEF